MSDKVRKKRRLKVIKPGVLWEPNKFGGSGPLVAELTEDIVEQFKLGPALERFGQALVQQMAKQHGEDVVGVQLMALEFTLIRQPK